MKVLIKLALLFVVIFLCGLIFYLNHINSRMRNQDIEATKELIREGMLFQNDEKYKVIKASDLIHLLRDPDPVVVIRALSIVGHIIDRWWGEEIDPVSNSLGSKNWLIRFHSAAALGQINSEKAAAVPALKMAWLKETNRVVLYQIFESLCNIGGEQVVWIFVESFGEQSQDDRSLLSAIGLIKLNVDRKYMLDSLKESFNNMSQDSKLFVLWVVGNQNESMFQPILIQAIEDDNQVVRQLAENYLVSIQSFSE